MIHQLRERRNEDSGFTLIELMVVVLIIAILVAIAVPTFLGARTRGQDRAAQATAKNALTTGRVIFTDTGDFAAGDEATFITNLGNEEFSITFQAAASSSNTVVSVHLPSATAAYYSVYSESGTCFVIEDDTAASGGTKYAYHTNTCDDSAIAGLTFTESW